MSVYLNDIPLFEAQKRLEDALVLADQAKVLRVEKILLDQHANGRYLAEAVWAKISSPHYHAAAMDGFALRSVSTAGASEVKPVSIKVGEEAVYVDTGDPMPTWADAVIPIELVEMLDQDHQISTSSRHPEIIRFRSAIPPWRNVRPLGEDIVATQLVLPTGHRLRPVDLGAIAACGHDTVVVAGHPRVAIIPTGSELVPIGQSVEAGDIIEFNSIMLAAQVEEWGGEVCRFPIVKDDFDLIREVVRKASREYDLILLLAGSSAGSEDFSAKVVESMGTLLVHGVAVRPGHPVILGMVNKSTKEKNEKIPIVGVPGYPVSAALTSEIFIKPLIFRWLGVLEPKPRMMSAILTRKVTSPAGDDDYLRVALGKVGSRVLAAPLARGAGVITSLVQADGILVIPTGIQGLAAGSRVDVRQMRSDDEIDRTIFAIGSHDMILDVMAQELQCFDRRLISANVGSLGGLVALRREEAHLAGTHLLDPESGDYNLPYINKYLSDKAVVVVTLVGREQGLMVQQGNPAKIFSLEDLVRGDVIFINRQRGSGTRVLLDYHLGLKGIQADNINGYKNEEYTHLAVAAAISSDRASCGLGITAAAKALELDFIPLYQERYDLVIPVEYYRSELMQPVLDLLQNTRFKKLIAGMAGYDISKMGQIVAEVG
jgi:putative molybdopterin biosynthesis protein